MLTCKITKTWNPMKGAYICSKIYAIKSSFTSFLIYLYYLDYFELYKWYMRNDLLIFVGFCFIFMSIILQIKNKDKLAFATVFLAAISFRLFAIYADPFLHDWDERFHALVAKNMMNNPFVPTLRPKELIPNNNIAWCCSNIWLHKQPLFLWQMALSMKLFGISEFTLRYPSMIMGSLMVPLVYRICQLLTRNNIIALSSAIFMCVSCYHLDLVSGEMGMDHNDVAFGFYILASIWAYTEYVSNPLKKWIVLIGVFAGCAVLNKWLTGILVFAGWGINILLTINKKETRKEIIHFIIALLCCIAIFLPWQVYTHIRFPDIARYEMAYNAKHIFEVVEGHKGTYWYYYDLLPDYIGVFVWMFAAVGLFIIHINTYNNKIAIAFTTYIAIVAVFFTFIVRSKLASYVFIIVPLTYITCSATIYWICDTTNKYLIKFWVLICLTSIPIFNYKKIFSLFNPNSEYRAKKTHNSEVYKQIHHLIPKDVNIVMNTMDFDDVEVMFYGNNLSCYNYSITADDFEIIKKRGAKIAVFKDRPGCVVPEYIKNYPYTYVITHELK